MILSEGRPSLLFIIIDSEIWDRAYPIWEEGSGRLEREEEGIDQIQHLNIY